MRGLLILPLLLGTPAFAWEAGADGALCTLTHEMQGAAIHLTYDPALPEYSISLTRPDAPWPVAGVFSLRFVGDRPLTISTDRHVLSRDDTSLTVTDRGFGNVLDGLQFNDTATALIAGEALMVPLDGAAPEVAAFRACGAAPAV